ncbi:unnamed protein product, partial [Arabidopsis halleri]
QCRRQKPKKKALRRQNTFALFVQTNEKIITIYFGVSAALILLTISFFAFSYLATQPRVPQFMLEDLYVDPQSPSVFVNLSSTNPSSKSSVYYSKLSLHVLVPGDFETETVFLQSKRQKPREVTTWTAVLANNNDNLKRTWDFLVIHGIADGYVIADIMFQWKSSIFSFRKFGLHVRCPVLLILDDLSSASRAVFPCSQHFHL